MTSSASASSDTSAEEVSVTDHPEKSRYEAFLNQERVGLAAYQLSTNQIIFTHTEVDDSAEGKGVGSAIATVVLDSARNRGLRVVPQCAFIARYISRHREYLDLVDEANRHLVDGQGD
jgi:predicted GNAT family acetyltransferase